MYHVNNNGDVKRCRATIQECRFGIHGQNAAETQAKFEASNNLPVVSSLKKSAGVEITLSVGEKTPDELFDKGIFYGKTGPRDVQLDALNGVVADLEENDSTQLIAACGTGKTYMHRQLLRNAMEAEGSNGIGIILTSSIRLAQDTASDLRPAGGYDESLGKFGKDYEVIEVHSNASGEEGRQSVKEAGVISVDRIYNQIDSALKDGKKIVIVSTYDSVNKVQEAQAKFADQDKTAADLLIHDEAHNILGQQKPTTIAQSDDNDLTAYVGFHNDIPGSLQSRKRLYSTATPIIRETDGDKESTGDVNALIETSLEMRKGTKEAQFERITVYSDDPLVGGVGGFISQTAAIESECLAQPSYQIRSSATKNTAKGLVDPVVDASGNFVERTSKTDLNANTYGALMSTLDAMVADPEDGKNPSTNVLAYVGSIDQSEGFKKSFKEVALAESKGMSVEEAKKNVNNADPELKRRARMRLLATNETKVLAAHSRQDSDSVKEREEAFKMFKNKAITSHEWTADKRVLANVNIFSEGVSISEIDTVVISDDDKLNEKSMTQAIGRAIRVVPGNDVKKFGHVIIPSITDGEGNTLNSASVNLAAYTATRVERGTTAAKLRGEKVEADNTTAFTVYEKGGSVKKRLAREYAQNSIASVEDLAIATEINAARTYLIANDRGSKDDNSSYIPFRERSKEEQFTAAKERINEKLQKLKKGDSDSVQYLAKVQSHLDGKTATEVHEITRNARVISAALATGDISSLNPKLATDLIKTKILRTEQKAIGISIDEKREFLKKYHKEVSAAIASDLQDKASPYHTEARKRIPETILKKNRLLNSSFAALRDESKANDDVHELRKVFNDILEDPDFVNNAFAAVEGNNRETIPLFRWVSSAGSIDADMKSLEKIVTERQHDEAVRGERAYAVDSTKVRKTGELNVAALRELLTQNSF